MGVAFSIDHFEAVIFDMDGVLIDSEPLWKIAMEKVFSDLGCKLSKNDFQRTVGLRIDEVINYWNKDQNLGVSDEKSVEDDIINRMIELVRENPIPLTGVMETLEYLSKNKLKIGLATSSPNHLLQAVLDGLKIDHFFDVAHSAEFEEFGKPHPAVYLETAKKLNVDSNKCLVIEDSLNGIISGMSAKMKVICIPEKTHLKEPRLKVADFMFEDMSLMLAAFKNG
ncbi:hexitol phosphatase HxpB [Crocinitomicaceae bacterium]|jgi:mannitol-1-/sugar-/sorbitol-6-/2-deoxyglucose-6-phosphatase|nr:hexitol phosphatase HxpB [Crocinitomicaceae bacterium]MDC3308590.1 hexitol phosphatase HxpB [Crocinitomicaceae bacterium]